MRLPSLFATLVTVSSLFTSAFAQKLTLVGDGTTQVTRSGSTKVPQVDQGYELSAFDEVKVLGTKVAVVTAEDSGTFKLDPGFEGQVVSYKFESIGTVDYYASTGFKVLAGAAMWKSGTAEDLVRLAFFTRISPFSYPNRLKRRFAGRATTVASDATKYRFELLVNGTALVKAIKSDVVVNATFSVPGANWPKPVFAGQTFTYSDSVHGW